MDDYTDEPLTAGRQNGRLAQLSVGGDRTASVNPGYSRFIRKLRFILPLVALGMTVVVLTWDEAGQRMTPMKKEDLIPASENIQNELLKPVFNSVDEKNQPYTITADRAVQDRQNPDIVELDKPSGTLKQTGGDTLEATAARGIYEQKSQKLNLNGDVEIDYSDGYKLSTEELRLDLETQKAYSGQNVHVEGPSGTLEATGLDGDAETGAVIFTGPAKVILQSGGKALLPAGSTEEQPEEAQP